jgi:hypothetical protein
MSTLHICRKHWQIRGPQARTGCNGVMYLQLERVGHLAQQPARPHPFQHKSTLLSLHSGARCRRTSPSLRLVGAPPSLLLQQPGRSRVVCQSGAVGLDPYGVDELE